MLDDFANQHKLAEAVEMALNKAKKHGIATGRGRWRYSPQFRELAYELHLKKGLSVADTFRELVRSLNDNNEMLCYLTVYNWCRGHTFGHHFENWKSKNL